MSPSSRIVFALAWLAPAAAAALPWTRIEDLPAADVYSLRLQDTQLFAGGLDVVHVGSADGTAWTTTAPVTSGSAGIEAVVSAGGALWVGLYGQGVHRSTDAGATWTEVGDGLTGLGARHVIALVEKDGRLFAGTGGAGVFTLDLAAPPAWTAFNDGIPTSTAGSVAALVLHGTTLLAPAGGNGLVYRLPEGAATWQEVALVPPLLPGLVTTDGVAAPSGVLLGTSDGAYHSTDDGLTWTFAGGGFVTGSETVVTAAGSVLFAGVNYLGSNHRLYRSTDAGVQWQELDDIPGAYLYALEAAGTSLFAARTDGLWSVPLASTPVRAQTWGGIKSGFRRPRRARRRRGLAPGPARCAPSLRPGEASGGT